MTKDQHIIYVSNLDPSDERESPIAISKLDVIVSNPKVKALSISSDQRGIFLLYEGPDPEDLAAEGEAMLESANISS